MGSIKNILWVAFISMVPIIELRGAIPAGAALGLPWYSCMLAAIVGNCIPVPFILLFIRGILDWMKRCPLRLFQKIALWLEQKAEKHKDKVDRYAFWGLLVLVAIPLPGTGAWTGALVAALFRVKAKTAVPAIILGVVGAAVIVILISYGVLSALEFLL